jgi:hypothetical protein
MESKKKKHEMYERIAAVKVSQLTACCIENKILAESCYPKYLCQRCDFNCDQSRPK